MDLSNERGAEMNIIVKAVMSDGIISEITLKDVSNIEHEIKAGTVLAVVYSGKWILNQFKMDTLISITEAGTENILYKKL